jgi:hypothetical protein
MTVTRLANLNGGIAVGGNKFEISASTGNAQVSGSLKSSGALTVGDNRLYVVAETGDAVFAGNIVIGGVAQISNLPLETQKQ